MSFFINGVKTENYGVSIGQGANISLLTPSVFKERFSHDWGDENGIEYWDEEVLYKAQQQYRIPYIVRGLSKVDVVSKNKEFIEIVQASAGFDLQSDVVIDAMKLYYKSADITGLGNTWLTGILNVVNGSGSGAEYGYLTTNTGIYITDNNNNKIIVKKWQI